MKRNTYTKIIFAFTVFFLTQEIFCQVNTTKQQQKSSGYASVNNLKIYYEIYGEGNHCCYCMAPI